tara:strand:+ start:4099 stop:10242 length:6144 start_codon:yes stop_codon:yes gene_type:complete
MSKKRSQRNTKSFKKARARAGISRQDLRSGGRVEAYGGGRAFGGRKPSWRDDREQYDRMKERRKAQPAPTMMGPQPQTPRPTRPPGSPADSNMAKPNKSPVDLPEYTDSERQQAWEDAQGRGTVGPIQQIKEQVPEETRKEVENLEKVTIAQLEKDPKVQELKAKTQEIINSGMSPEQQQQALNNLAGEVRQVMQVALQQPAMQQAVKSLERRAASAVPVVESEPQPGSDSGGDEGDGDDGGGNIIGTVLSAIIDATLVIKDAAIGTGLSLAAGVIGRTGQVMDMMTGHFRKDEGQEALFRDSGEPVDWAREANEAADAAEAAQNNAGEAGESWEEAVDREDNFLAPIREDGRVLDDDQSYIDTGPGSSGNTGDRGSGQGGSGSTIKVGDDGEVINDESSSDTIGNRPGSNNENKGDDVTDNQNPPYSPPDDELRETFKKSGEQLYQDDGSLALKREVDTILQNRTFTPEEQKEKFLASDASKLGEDLLAPNVMSQSSDGQWWPNPLQRDAYEEWLKEQPESETLDPTGTVTKESDIQQLATNLTPDQSAAAFKAYKQSEDYDPLKYGDGRLMDSQVITKSSDGLEWPTPGAAAEYEAWLKDQPKAPQATATAVDDPTAITAETGEVARADLPGRTLKPEEQKKRFIDTEIFKNIPTYSGIEGVTFSSDGQMWNNRAQKNAYEKWLKTAPATEMDLEAATYDAAEAKDLAAIEAAIGTVSKEPTAASASVTATTAAQRDAEQEAAAKATAAERPGRKLSPEEQKERFLASDEFKKGDDIASPTVMTQSSDGQWWPNPAIAKSYDEWLNKQPEVTSEYAEGVTTDETYEIADVDDPTVTTRTGRQISPEVIARLTDLAQERGVALEDLPEYKDQIVKRKEQTGDAATKDYEDRLGLAPSETAAEAKYYGVEKTPEAEEEAIDKFDPLGFKTREARTANEVAAPDAATMDDVSPALKETRGPLTAGEFDEAVAEETNLENLPAFELVKEREAKTGEAAQRIERQLGEAPSIDLEGREAILGAPPIGDAAQIGGIPTMAAAKMQAVTGTERTVAAEGMAEVVVDLPKEITAAVLDDPATVTAQLDNEPQEVKAAVAALPEEALVSVQMEGLLAGMEEGKTPTWARPAVDAIEQMMARRGLSASTVGRDALFNAIIQSALPMAQSNAQALQQRAQQNLDNRQQANLQRSRQVASQRLANLANMQTAASQTAQMAQQVRIRQGEFEQQAVVTSKQLEETARLTGSSFEQERAQQESRQRQETTLRVFSSAEQKDLANLEYLNAEERQNMSADQQMRLAEYNARIDKVMRQADLDQDMEKANLNSRLQVELKHLTELNVASRDRMSSVNQERLVRLQTLVDFKKTNVQLAQQMDMANMSNEQQVRMAELADRSAADAANFTEANRFELTRLQNYARIMSENTQLRQQAELANFSSDEKISLAELTAADNASSDNLNAAQKVELANLNARLQESTQEAQMRQQIIAQDFSNKQQIELANLEALNRADSESLSNAQQSLLAEYNAEISRKIRQAELNQDVEKANLDAELKVELAELSEKNATSRANMTAEQQTRLANLNVLVDFRKTNAQLAQQMDLANLANEQQIELAELQDRISTDAANFTEENRFRFQELNNYVQVMSQNEEFKQRADLAKLSMQEKIELANLQSKNQADSESMSAENVAQLEMFEKRMRAGEVNAQLAQQMGLANLSNQQSAAMFNAQVNANLDMKQFDFEQQTEIANSKFLQTMTVTDLNNRQQTVMQDAATLAAMDMQAADLKTQASIQNARNFLQMDLANLSNEQQAVILDQQLEQQRILSNQSAENASRQFNATSENQVNQFMANLGADMSKFNAVQANTMEQFNVSEQNRIEALNAENEIEVDKINATISAEISRFNAQLESNREQWNAANAQAVEQSNVEWRRKANMVDTAAQNAANAANAANAFGLSSRDSAFLWQELRDNLNKDFTRELTYQERQVAMINSAMQSEAFLTDAKYSDQREVMFDLMEKLMGITFTGGYAATGEGNTTTEDDAGNVGSGVDLEERRNKFGQIIES